MKDDFSNNVAQPPPRIPDHRLLRRIGKGSYGEVWLARGVTGVLRAVKIVRRCDFDDDHTFEREFEGIRKFEPVSRSHRGLVQVLHIGRNEEESFYYYVMELGDDALGDSPAHEVEYEPRTLRGDVLRRGRLPVAECIAVGEVLADALRYLHGQGLTHRDIKPSNVIFVEGVPKLADIGLVAPPGQRTFVGTEGFTPPEGPGRPQGDIYSLGMVLYEVSSGKDRLEFPEVPADLPDAERASWLRLNEVICRACEPDAAVRYQSAGAMHDDLAALAAGRTPRRPGRRWLVPAAAAAVIGLAALVLFHRQLGDARRTTEPPPLTPAVPSASVPVTGSVKIATSPPGATVSYQGHELGTTPLEHSGLPFGKARFILGLDGYRTTPVEVEITPDHMAVIAEELDFYSPPVAGQPWRNHLGMRFDPDGRNHKGAGPVQWSEYSAYVEGTGRPAAGSPARVSVEGKQVEVAMVTQDGANAFCAWLLERGRRLGFLGPEHFYTFEPRTDVPGQKAADGKELIAFTCSVRSFLYGSLHIESTPSRAEVYEASGGRFLGHTPLDLPRVLPGTLAFQIRMEGHEKQDVSVEVAAEQRKELTVSLPPSRGVVFGRPWTNSLGMKFVPLQDLMVCIWETRLADWDAYRKQAKGPESTQAVPSATFRQGPDEPVAGVSRDAAMAFTRWLTEVERATGFIAENHVYRLPTDAEWSRAAGLDEPAGRAPYQLDGQNKLDYAWGREWPPPAGAGNVADVSAPAYLRRRGIIRGYRDGFVFTSPAGSFPPNKNGLHDIAGNVWEWVADDYGGDDSNPASRWGVSRGGCWAEGRRSALLLSMRNILKPDFGRDGLCGFRVVLDKLSAPGTDGPGAPMDVDPTPFAGQDAGESDTSGNAGIESAGTDSG